jgi:hypothetical protein
MKDAKDWLERFRVQAEECRLISKLATNPTKRETFERLAAVHDKAAADLERLIASGNLTDDPGKT